MSSLESTMKYIGFFVAAIYLVIGVLVLLKPIGLFNIPEKFVVPLGIVMIVYALFRGYRVYQQNFGE
jgi:hypothetical protein